MSVHVMLDLETFGVGRKAMPISIGAVKFDGAEILDKFHVGIIPETAEAAGFKTSVSTVQWWLAPERQDAWKAWRGLEKVSITEALVGFALWAKEGVGVPTERDPLGQDPLVVWGNGATFDNVILRDAYELCGFEYPTEFWNDRCYRTVKCLRPDIKLQRVGTHHSAVDDAKSQAIHLQQIAAAMGWAL